MSTSSEKLSHDDVSLTSLTGWREVDGVLVGRFATGDFMAGTRFVDRVAAAAEEANHHPDVHLTYPEVRLELVSHDVGGLTSRDVDLARAVTAIADELGADPIDGP